MIFTPYGIIWVTGRQISSSILEDLLEIKVDLREKKASSGHFILKDENAQYFDSKVFRKGAWVAFMLGWAHELDMFGPYMIKGYKIEFPEDGFPKLTVKFQDLSIRMHKEEKKRKHTGPPKDILKRIAAEYGLGYDIESIGNLEFSDDKPLIQANLTDAAFLQRLAHRYGYVWGVDGVNLYFRRPMDFDEINRQMTIPRLSWAEKTLKSYSFEVKTSGGKGKKESKQNQSNIDFEGTDTSAETDAATLNNYQTSEEEFNKTYGTDAAANKAAAEAAQKSAAGAVGGFDTTALRALSKDLGDSKLAKILDLGEELEGGDEEPKPTSTDATKAKKSDEETGWFADAPSGTFSLKIKTSEWEDEVVESKSNTPGAAAPENQEEAELRAGGKLLRTTEMIVGQFEPPIASVWYKPGKAVFLDLPSTRLTGKYHIEEVSITWNIQGFKQVINKAYKRTFLPAMADKNKTDDAPLPGSEDAAREKLPDTTTELGWVPDTASGRFNVAKIVDGAQDTESEPPQSKKTPEFWSQSTLNSQQSTIPVNYISIQKNK